MKTITIKDIRAMGPCYDPTKYLPEDWSGTALDILRMEQVPAADRLWVVQRDRYLTTRQLQEYALACAQSVAHLTKDSCVNTCLQATRDYLDGKIAVDSLNEARARVYDSSIAVSTAARSAAESARSAAESARSAAESARSAAESARSAAWSARSAAESAWSARSAAESARSARSAEYAVASYAYTRTEQEELNVSLLITILESGVE